jgi:hypothetical protein
VKIENPCKTNLRFDETDYGIGISSVIATVRIKKQILKLSFGRVFLCLSRVIFIKTAIYAKKHTMYAKINIFN